MAAPKAASARTLDAAMHACRIPKYTKVSGSAQRVASVTIKAAERDRHQPAQIGTGPQATARRQHQTDPDQHQEGPGDQAREQPPSVEPCWRVMKPKWPRSQVK